MAGSTTKASTYDARIKDKPKLDFTLRFQGNALIELFRSVYVFAKWSCNRLLGQNPF